MENIVNSPNPKFSAKFIIGILILVLLIGGIPLTLSQTQVQQILSGRAWSTSQSANAACTISGTVAINVKFSNTESNRSMIVNVYDSQSGKSVSLGTVYASQTKTGVINTGRTSLNSGSVTFKLAWADSPNVTDSRTASYNSVSTCIAPTPTPTRRPSPTPTRIPTRAPTPTPTGIPTPTPTRRPTPTPTRVLTPTPTRRPTPTPTGVYPTPTKCPTPGTVKNIQIKCPYCTPSPSPN